MPPDDAPRVEVSFTPEFKRNVRRLARKYRSLRSDVAPVIEHLERGQTPGDRVQRTGHAVFKVRVRNLDAQRGKSGGYRVIYYLKTQARVVLVTIYSKSDQGDISADAIRKIISEYES